MRRSCLLFLLAWCCSSAIAAEKPIAVVVGQEFRITLDSNANSGNQWLMARPLDEHLLRLLGTEYKRGRPGSAGSAGNEILSFKALGEGKTQIHLKYGKLWERDPAPVQPTNFIMVISRSAASAK